MNVDCDEPSSARRRRERRLRSWLRHERTTVAAALAEALHHSAPKVGAVPNNAPRSQKTARASGEHPGVLKEPEVQAAAVGYVAVSTPLLVVASLAGGDEVDATTTTKYLLKCALRKRKEEEEERRRKEKKEHEELMKRAQSIIDDAASLPALPTSSSAGKRKKRRKKRTPRTSSRSLRSRARRRQRQWHACGAGSPGYVPLHTVFPSVVVWPEMLGIMAVVTQKDSTTLVDNHGSGTCRVGFTGYDAPHVMTPSGVAKPRMLCILAGMDQMDSYDMVPMVQTSETVESPQLQSIHVVDISFVAQRQFRMVQTVRRTFHFPVAAHGGRCPCCAGRAGSLPRRGEEAGSMVQTVRVTMDIPQLLYTVADVPVVRSSGR